MASPHALVINALNDAIRASISKSTKDLLDAISKDYGIDLEELRAKYMIGAEPSKKSTPTTKTEKEKTPCIATTKKNKPCRRFAVDGSCHCKLHVRFIAEKQQQQQQQPVKSSSPEKKVDKKKKKMSFVSPDNLELRREFDAVFEEIFEEEITEDERGEPDPEPEMEAEPEPEPEMDFDDEATEVADDDEATEVADDDEATEVADDDEATEVPDPDFDDEATEVAEDERSEVEAEAEPEPEEIRVKFWKDASAKRPSMHRTLTLEKGMTFDRVLDRLAGDREAADFVDRGFAILSGENRDVVADLTSLVAGEINVLARDDDNFPDLEWRYLDDMPDIEAFLEKALLDCEQEEI